MKWDVLNQTGLLDLFGFRVEGSASTGISGVAMNRESLSGREGAIVQGFFNGSEFHFQILYGEVIFIYYPCTFLGFPLVQHLMDVGNLIGFAGYEVVFSMQASGGRCIKSSIGYICNVNDGKGDVIVIQRLYKVIRC